MRPFRLIGRGCIRSGSPSLLLVLALLQPAVSTAQPLSCPHLEGRLSGVDLENERQLLAALDGAETTLQPELSALDLAACFKRLGDLHRDAGSYEAERLYEQALELAPEHIEILTALGEYYRNYRGSRGLFAESEAYYLRALETLDRQLAALETERVGVPRYLQQLREQIIRGRIELNKREGLGLLIPRQDGDRFGTYLSLELEEGDFPVSLNDLTTPARTLLNVDPRFDPRSIIRTLDRSRQRYRLRLRFGELPFIDLAWNQVAESDTLASQTLPISFSDIEVEDLEVAVEDRTPLRTSDILWRLEYQSGDFDAEGPALEELERVTAMTTWTKNFGRLKANFDLLGSVADNDIRGAGTDRDRLVAAAVRLVHFRPPAVSRGRVIDPRGFEYQFGVVERRREFGEVVELVQTTVFGGIKLTELVPRTDIRLLPNYFSNTVKGKNDEESSNLELNMILTHRVIDRVNDMTIDLSQGRVGLVQWSFDLRLFEDYSLGTVEAFERRGFTLTSFVELLSAPLNFSTAILGASVEYHDYHLLDETEKLGRIFLRMGF